MDFDTAFVRVIGHEKGFQNDPNDRGNWTGGQIGLGELRGTNYGISAAAYPGEDIAGMTLQRAKEIYRRDYWGRTGCDQVPEGLKFDLFDTAVNSGQVRAVQFLQRAAGAVDDGRLGPQTLWAVRNMDPERLFARFNGHRLDFLNDNPEQWTRYGRGWAQRIAENLKAA